MVLPPHSLPLNSLDYGKWRVLKSKGKATAHQNGLSEANLLATAGCQSWAMLRRNCRTLRPRLEKVVAVGGGNSDFFSSYCPSLSIKTIFWA
jgi:hypothetical protein